jgi:hypothetical protein
MKLKQQGISYKWQVARLDKTVGKLEKIVATLHENWWQNWKRWMTKLLRLGWLSDEDFYG